MKIIFLLLILYLSINLISSFSWFNFRSKDRTKQVTDSPSTHPQRQGHSRHAVGRPRQSMASTDKNSTKDSLWQRALNRQRYRSRNPATVARSADDIPRNRFHDALFRQQYRSFRKSTPASQVAHVKNKTNNRFLRRRLRPSYSLNRTAHRHNSVQNSLTKASPAVRKASKSSALKATRSRSVFGKKNRLTTTAKQSNRDHNQRVFDINDYQERLRAFQQRGKPKNVTNTHSYLRSALKHRKRRSEEDNGNSNLDYPMVLVRDAN